ncbi:MAG: hypothetical protein WC838_05520 [Candidatus Margulisiibacteriota bacterium]|jgi:hypothetical protein
MNKKIIACKKELSPTDPTFYSDTLGFFNYLLYHLLPGSLQTEEMRKQAVEYCQNSKDLAEVCSGIPAELFSTMFAKALISKCPKGQKANLLLELPKERMGSELVTLALLQSPQGQVGSDHVSLIKEKVDRKDQQPLLQLCMEKADPSSVAELLKQIPPEFINLDLIRTAMKQLDKCPIEDRQRLLAETRKAITDAGKFFDLVLTMKEPEEEIELLIRSLPLDKYYLLPVLICLGIDRCEPRHIPKMIARVQDVYRTDLVAEKAIDQCAPNKLYLLFFALEKVVGKNNALHNRLLAKVLAHVCLDSDVPTMARRLEGCPAKLKNQIMTLFRDKKPEIYKPLAREMQYHEPQ